MAGSGWVGVIFSAIIFFRVPNYKREEVMKPHNQPLEFPPPPQGLYVLAFFLYFLSVLLALRLDRSSAITKITGSIPAEYIKIELFVVNSQWGRICKKKNIPIF